MCSSSAFALPQNWSEHTVSSGNSLGTVPVDSAASHNNNRGAVRYANPANDDTVIAVWNLGTAGTTPPAPMAVFGAATQPSIKSGYATDLQAFFGYRPSDRIQIGNQLGVSIGSGSAGSFDQNYIELFRVGPTPSFIDQTLTPHPSNVAVGEELYVTGGRAHDVAITRDGEWAVVNADNWIHVVHLDVSAAYPQFDFNIGKYDFSVDPPVAWGQPQPCTPNGSVDSVEVTNDRAVVTTARWNPDLPIPGFTTWVYIIDLSDPSSSPVPRIVLQHEIPIPPEAWDEMEQWPTEFGDWPHDVAVTPHTDIVNSGGQALAVVTSRHNVAAYNLVTNAFVNNFFDWQERRRYQDQVDSVEMTGQSAIVIADRIDPSNNFAPLHWQVKTFSLHPVNGLVPGPMYPGTDPVGVEGFAHDLAIEREHDIGIVRTSFDNVFIPDLSSPPPTITPIPSPNGSNAHAYSQFMNLSSHSVFSSDSVAIGTRQDDDRLMAVTLGGRFNGSTLRWQGEADILHIDVSTSPYTVTSLAQVPVMSNDDPGCVPLDLSIAFNASGQDEVVVRCVDPNPEAPNSAGADLVRISLLSSTPPPNLPQYAIVQSYGGNGFPVAADALAVPPLSGYVQTTKWMLSVSQDDFQGLDYVHIAK